MSNRGGGALLAIVVAVATNASCGSSSNTSAPGGAPRDGCSAFAAAIGDMTRVCYRSSIAEQAGATEAKFKATCVTALALEGSGASEAMFTACAEAVRSNACGTALDALPACKPPPGTLADGAPCVSPLQCKSLFCNKTTEACGVCAARVAIGSRCTGADCVDGARCDTSTLSCVADARNPIGGACSNGPAGPFCEATAFCDSASSTCRAIAKPGESCANAPCGGGWSRCDAVSKVCFVPTTAGEGEACGPDSKAVCGPGLTCGDKPTTCFRLKVVEPGGDCSGDFTSCALGPCMSGRCQMILADGAACGADAMGATCGPGASCVEGKCQQPQQIVCK